MLLAVSALIGCADPAPKQVKTTVRTEFYDITGQSADQMRADLDKNSPVLTAGERYDAGTDWWVTWRYDYDTSNHDCLATNVRVSLDLTFHYPKWERPRDADTGLTRTWHQYMDRLRDHEQGHARIASSGAHRLLTALSKEPFRDVECETLEGRLDAIGYSLIEEITTQQEQYDHATRHGATHGAVFP